VQENKERKEKEEEGFIGQTKAFSLLPIFSYSRKHATFTPSSWKNFLGAAFPSKPHDDDSDIARNTSFFSF